MSLNKNRCKKMYNKKYNIRFDKNTKKIIICYKNEKCKYRITPKKLFNLSIKKKDKMIKNGESVILLDNEGTHKVSNFNPEPGFFIDAIKEAKIDKKDLLIYLSKDVVSAFNEQIYNEKLYKFYNKNKDKIKDAINKLKQINKLEKSIETFNNNFINNNIYNLTKFGVIIILLLKLLLIIIKYYQIFKFN